MKYKIYKMKFMSAVHFGNRTLEDGEYTFLADTLFSALCQEAVKFGEDYLHEFYKKTKDGEILFSDAFPYMGKKYFLPKPMMKIENDIHTGDSVIKKAYKKLKYIPADKFNDYLSGKFDVLNTENLDELGIHETKNVVSIRGKDETEPYRIGTYRFNEGNGLYFIVGYREEEGRFLIEDLLKSLMYSGIGGKRGSGFGRFELYSDHVPKVIENRLQQSEGYSMSLSICLPQKSELKEAMEEAEYMVVKRSGFVQSETYSNTYLRKKDLYAFKAGACFSHKFSGDIYDVSTKEGQHAVYRYAKPLFMEVSICRNI